MDDYNKEIKRKIAARKLAVKCLPDSSLVFDDHGLASARIKQLHDKLDQMNAVLYEMNAHYLLFADADIHCTGRFRIVRGIKKIIKKTAFLFIRIFYYPIIRKQNNVNAFTVQTFNEMKAVLDSMAGFYSDIGEGIETVHARAEENIIENLAIISEYRKITALEKENNENKSKINYLMDQMGITCDISLLEDAQIDYFAFENKFRGPRDQVKLSQSEYIEYFRQNAGSPILDIGCGRGEFLELMFDHGLSARGIDCYPPFIEYCTKRGFDVEQADALSYLNSLPDASLGGIFMAHVAEHLTNDYLVALISAAYRKLKPECHFVLETPNPECLAAITEFNIDISHKKPLHFQSLKNLFESADFTDITRYNNTTTKWPNQLQKMDENDAADDTSASNKVINANTEAINTILFGYRDYTLIARK